jgi:uncharacterized membrane protein YphA (DoxX/SURF4 family)
MNTVLWVIQVLLAAFFFMAGFGKLSNSRQKHIADGHIKAGSSLLPIRVLGVLELLGCIGIILPWLTGIAPVLTPVSALGFCLIMLAGLAVHAQKKEYKMLPILFIVLIMAAMVACRRFQKTIL